MYRFQFRPPSTLTATEVPLEGEPYWDSARRRLGFWNYAEQRFNWFRIPLGDEDENYIPGHQWVGTTLQFRRPDGTYDPGVDLKGTTGEPGVYPEASWSAQRVPYRARTVVYHRNVLWLAVRNTPEEPTAVAVDWVPWLVFPQSALDALINAEQTRLTVVAATADAEASADDLVVKTAALNALYGTTQTFVDASETTLADVQASVDAYRALIAGGTVPASGIAITTISGLDATNVQVALAKIVAGLALRAPLANPTFTGVVQVPDPDINDPAQAVNWGVLDRELRRITDALSVTTTELRTTISTAIDGMEADVDAALTAVAAQQTAFETAANAKIADLQAQLDKERISRFLDLGI